MFSTKSWLYPGGKSSHNCIQQLPCVSHDVTSFLQTIVDRIHRVEQVDHSGDVVRVIGFLSQHLPHVFSLLLFQLAHRLKRKKGYERYDAHIYKGSGDVQHMSSSTWASYSGLSPGQSDWVRDFPLANVFAQLLKKVARRCPQKFTVPNIHQLAPETMIFLLHVMTW